MTNFTELEKSAIRALNNALYAEYGFSDVDVADLAEWMSVEVSTAKGVLGSLCKKGICETEVFEPFKPGAPKKVYELIHFTQEGAKYHKNHSIELGIEFIEV